MIRKISVRNIIVLIVILISGIFYIRYVWVKTLNEQSENIMQIARSVEAGLPVENLKMLEGQAGDIEKPEYREIKQKLMDVISVNPRARFAYIYILRDDKIYFVADSEPETSEDYSPPGQEYTEAKPEDK